MSSINRELTLTVKTFTVNTRWFLCFHFDEALSLQQKMPALLWTEDLHAASVGKKEKYYLASNQVKSSKCRGSIQICVLLHCFVACSSY